MIGPMKRRDIIDGQEKIDGGYSWCILPAPMATLQGQARPANGYIRVPEDHPWVGRDTEDFGYIVHGGVTFARDRWFGFDTLHAYDVWPDTTGLLAELYNGSHVDENDKIVWTVERVREEVFRFLDRAREAALDCP